MARKNYNLSLLWEYPRGEVVKGHCLNKQEEIHLWQIIKENIRPHEVQTAKEKILLAQYSLLNYLAYKKTRDRHIVDDLVALGIEVCLNRMAYFEPARGHRFSTYINLFIKKAMDKYYKNIKNQGITYYPVGGYAVLEFDEMHYHSEFTVSGISETVRQELLHKLDKLDQEERELVERHYFKEERLIDIARSKWMDKSGDYIPCVPAAGPGQQHIEYSGEQIRERIIKKEHDRLRQRLHRAERKLGKIISGEQN